MTASASARLPRGVRNNNPGNIEYDSGTKWQGLADPPVEGQGRFCRFAAPVWGVRAIARILITYQDRHGLDTVAGIIGRWAPASENDTAAYAAVVRAKMGVEPGARLDVHSHAHMRPLVEAIIRHENGVQPYTDAQLDKGLALAGVVAPAKSLQASRSVRGAQVAIAGATGAAVVPEVLAHVGEAAALGRTVAEWAPWLALAVVLGGAGLVVYARWDDLRRLVR